jgi:hypothetical protein
LRSLFVIVAKLFFQYAINTTQFLFLS